MLPHPWAIDQNFYFLVKSPPLARTPPPHGVYIDRCINSTLVRLAFKRRATTVLCQTQFTNYKYIRVHLSEFISTAASRSFVIGNSYFIQLNSIQHLKPSRATVVLQPRPA